MEELQLALNWCLDSLSVLSRSQFVFFVLSLFLLGVAAILWRTGTSSSYELSEGGNDAKSVRHFIPFPDYITVKTAVEKTFIKLK